MRRRPPRSTRTDTLFPYTTLCRSNAAANDAARGAACPCRAGKSDLQLAQAIGQQPQGAIEANIGINALHRAGLLAASVGAAPMQSAFGQVLLGAVEHAPQVRTAVVEPARSEERRVGKECVGTGRTRWSQYP